MARKNSPHSDPATQSVSEQTRRNRSAGGRKAAAAKKIARDWRERSAERLAAGMAGAGQGAADYVPTPVSELIERIRAHQSGPSAGSGQGG